MTTLSFLLPDQSIITVDNNIWIYQNQSYKNCDHLISREPLLAEQWQKSRNQLEKIYEQYDLPCTDDEDCEYQEFNNPLFIWQDYLQLEDLSYMLCGSLSFEYETFITINKQRFVLMEHNNHWTIAYQDNHTHRDYDSYDVDAFKMALYWCRHYLPALHLTTIAQSVDAYRPFTYQTHTLPAWSHETHQARQLELQSMGDMIDAHAFLSQSDILYEEIDITL